MIHLTHEEKQNVIDAEAQISSNCDFPNGRGTDNWDVVLWNEEHQVFYITKPPINGWSDAVESFTQEEMMAGVENVVEMEW